jgi:hypothetical protein
VFRPIRSDFPVLLLAFLAVAPSPALAQQSLADQFADQQDFSSHVTAPNLSDDLDYLVAYVIPNGSYDSLGPPFATPHPPLPPNVTRVHTACQQWTSFSGPNPRCVTHHYEWQVVLTFTDGSTYSYSRGSLLQSCSDGSWQDDDSSHQRADAGPPGYGNVESIQRTDLYQRRDSDRIRKFNKAAAAGRTVSYVGSPVRPVVDTDDLEIRIGTGGTLDLRQNPAAGGPLFVSNTPALLRCDTILLDPGVQLADLFQPPPILQPGTAVATVDLGSPGNVAIDDHLPHTAELQLFNSGNAADLVQVAWMDTNGWVVPGQTQLALPIGGPSLWPVSVLIPPGTPPGTAGDLLVQVTSLTQPMVSETRTVHLVHDPVGVFRFGIGTPGCTGAYAVDATGPLATGGPPTQLQCTQVPPLAPVLWMVGFGVAPDFATWQFPGLPDFYVDPFGNLFVTFFVFADAGGLASASLQAPPDPFLKGLELVCQTLTPTGPCAPASISSSPALGMVVQ